MQVLVTGATGYVGGRLIPFLLEAGHSVRVLVRDEQRIAGRPWRQHVSVYQGDVRDAVAVKRALLGVDAAYYLVHSMAAGKDFEARDAEAAHIFGSAAASMRLKHLIYLGGIVPGSNVKGETNPNHNLNHKHNTNAAQGINGKAKHHTKNDKDAAQPAPIRSKHLSSRARVGEILAGHCPTTEFRAGPVIGSGSASFEMVRYLTERLPIMVTPKWVKNAVQPIAVRNALEYLSAALEVAAAKQAKNEGESGGAGGGLGVIDIGTQPLTFKEMMLGYAQQRGLKRVILPVPILAPWLAARWVGAVTPISNSVAVPLVKGIVAPVVGNTQRAKECFPHIQPMPYAEAVQRALGKIQNQCVETNWSDALGAHREYNLVSEEGFLKEVRQRTTHLPRKAVFNSLCRIGGARGWPAWDWAWRARGILDILVGGPGLRRGRRDPDKLQPGDALDFWRVEVVESPARLRLRAEMRTPGKAWLQWEISDVQAETSEANQATGISKATNTKTNNPQTAPRTRIVQTAYFAPLGLAGHLYWWALYPVHLFIFGDMLRAIVRQAEKDAAEAGK